MKKILTSALLISLMVVSCKKEETAPVTDTTTEEHKSFSVWDRFLKIKQFLLMKKK